MIGLSLRIKCTVNPSALVKKVNVCAGEWFRTVQLQ